eukprot:3243169-Rhodomonas_salina.1
MESSCVVVAVERVLTSSVAADFGLPWMSNTNGVEEIMMATLALQFIMVLLYTGGLTYHSRLTGYRALYDVTDLLLTGHCAVYDVTDLLLTGYGTV